MIVYIAGPYRGDVDANIQRAREVAIEMWRMGYTVFCPHLNTAHFEIDCGVEDARYLQGDLEILARCDAMVLIHGWEKSSGAKDELAFARAKGILVWYWPAVPIYVTFNWQTEGSNGLDNSRGITV